MNRLVSFFSRLRQATWFRFALWALWSLVKWTVIIILSPVIAPLFLVAFVIVLMISEVAQAWEKHEQKRQESAE